MGLQWKFTDRSEMASPWRRRPVCTLVAERPHRAALRDISAAGAVLDTNAPLGLGTRIELRHPDAGSIYGVVASLSAGGLTLAFEPSERSVAFALAAITADMSKPEG